MNKSWLTFAVEVGSSLRDGFMLPGEAILSAVISAQGNVFGDDERLFVIIFAAASWFLVLVVVIKLISLVCRAVQRAWAALVLLIVNYRTMLKCRKKPPKLRQPAEPSDSYFEVHFDKLDLAVLNSAATLGPGNALTAPDLAKEFNLRPPQVQTSLEKLAINMMLNRAFGAPDDYQNYRLSSAGATFLSMWKRKQS